MSRPVLILHGGGGPATVAPLSAHFDSSATPTHPGWNGEPLGLIENVAGLAQHYATYLEEQNLSDVLVVGSSLGGWIGAELALASSRVSGYIALDTAGILVQEEPMRNFFGLTPRQVAEYSWHDGEKFFVDPSTFPAERAAAQRGNMASMKLLAGDPYMHDLTLQARLSDLAVPSLVLWGDSDRIFTPGYGRAFAAAIPGAMFELIADAGHLPHLEQPVATLAAIDAWLASVR